MRTDLLQLFAAQPWVERLGWTLIHFLWQGALIAAAYAVTQRLRSAQARYLLACVALAAMILAPIATFSLTAPTGAAPAIWIIGKSVQEPAFPVEPPFQSQPAAPALAAHADPVTWVVLAWFAGTLVFCVRLTGGWMVAVRMRSKLTRPAPAEWQLTLDQLKTRIQISRPVRLLISAIVQVPTVVGWLRPVVLVPIGALAGLPPDHIEALLAHELAHIHRHDYLVNILQSVIEALLFYHPAVWWISKQIRNERELCCDDIAVAISGDAVNYARALADLESHRPARFKPALAANGGALKDRIARLLGSPRSGSNLRSGAGAAICATAILVTALAAFAQPAPPPPAFEVTSVKPVQPPFEYSKYAARQGRLDFKAASLAECLSRAYVINRRQIIGPDWLDKERFDILATAPAGTADEQLMPMLRTLMADRFGMVVHREIRDVTEFALTVTKNGPRLKQSNDQDTTDMSILPQRGIPNGWVLKNASMAKFVDFLTSFGAQRDRALDRPIVDKTGLKSKFDFEFVWTPETGQPPADDTAAPSIFTAVQDQLGLKLDAQKGPVEVLVVDHVEKVPTAN